MSLKNIAQQLIDMKKKIILIYAFNGTGKTQLSVAYKDATKQAGSDQHTGVYYNAFSEDLFVWDNDEKNDGVCIKLNILPSSLNQFHSYVVEQNIRDKLAAYNPKYNFRFELSDDAEQGIKSVNFFVTDNNNKDTCIKISRGEERIFVWCFYLVLFEVENWTNKQDAHIFVDDPVSSLDEHNIFITANTLFQLIENNYEKKKVILTTHHIGLFSILADRLTKGEKSEKYKKDTSLHLLKREQDKLVLENAQKKGNVFLYHLHLLQVLNDAKSTQLYTYHFALLRQLLENISSFQGDPRTGRVLEKIGIKDSKNTVALINQHSHKTAYYFQTEAMSESDKTVFSAIFDKLIKTYHFQI